MTKKKIKKFLSIKKSAKSKVIFVPVSTILEIWKLSIHIDIYFLIYTLNYCFNFLNYLIFKLHFIHYLQKLRFLKMMGKISDILLSETSDNDRRIALEGLVISSDQEGNNKPHNKNNKKTLPEGLVLFTPIIVSAIDNIKNIKCKHRDINEIYRYFSRTVVTTNEGREPIEIIVVEIVNTKAHI